MMKVAKTVLIVFVSLILLVGAIFFALGFFKEKPGGIRVNTSPNSSVYINGAFVGKSPYAGVYKAGEITLKLVPEGTDKNLLSFETKINLVPGIETLVKREFAETEEASSGDISSFDKLSTKETSLVVVTTPDNAQVSLDGVQRGFAPYKTSVIAPAAHQITVRAPGFVDRVMTLTVQDGYRLTVFAKLAKMDSGEIETQEKTDLSKVNKNYVEILNTPTGFLRVRTQPGSAGDEIAEVKPGSKYTHLETDVATGWYKIQYDEPKPGLPNGITGWVSNQYSRVIDEDGKDATVSANLNP